MSSIGLWWEKRRQRKIDDAWDRRRRATDRQVKRSWEKQIAREDWVEKKAPHALVEYTLRGIAGGALLSALGVLGVEAFDTQSIPTLSEVINTLTNMKGWVEAGAGAGGLLGFLKGAGIKHEDSGAGGAEFWPGI